MTIKKAGLLAASITVALGSGASLADQSFEHVICRAGTLTPLAQAEKMVVVAVEHRGVAISDGKESPFIGDTQRCAGTTAILEGVPSGGGWCRSVDPKTGNWHLVDWTIEGKPGHGTFRFRYGTGEWKGITGGGSFEPMEPTKPVDAGTYQNCVRIKGTYKLPG